MSSLYMTNGVKETDFSLFLASLENFLILSVQALLCGWRAVGET